MKSAHPFLMFQGDASAALDLYERVFEDFSVRDIQRKAGKDGQQDGEIERATITVAGQDIMVYDSPPVHDFSFTPSISIFLECEDEAELDRLASALSDDGTVMMPADDYGFSRKFAWVADPFGVSWQLNLS